MATAVISQLNNGCRRSSRFTRLAAIFGFLIRRPSTRDLTRRVGGAVDIIGLGLEKTGWDVARRARELSPNLPVIYVTSVADEEWTSQGVPNSILISKPFAPAQITTAISQLLNAGEALPSE